MELAKHVRRIDSFLNGYAEDRWWAVSEEMAMHTAKITPRDNEFSSCQTADQFCAACDTIAHRICSGALFAFKHKFNRFMSEIIRKEHDPEYERVSDQIFAKKLVTDLKKVDDAFLNSINDFVSNLKTAFYLYFYADAIRNAPATEQQLQYATALCRTQSAVLNFVGHTQLDMEALNCFPQFKDKFTSLNPQKDTAILLFFATCVVLPWTAIPNPESADHALCTILQSVSTPGLPTRGLGAMETWSGPLGAMPYAQDSESSGEAARRMFKKGAFIFGCAVALIVSVALVIGTAGMFGIVLNGVFEAATFT
jgi:hypothetical protein